MVNNNPPRAGEEYIWIHLTDSLQHFSDSFPRTTAFGLSRPHIWSRLGSTSPHPHPFLIVSFRPMSAQAEDDASLMSVIVRQHHPILLKTGGAA